MSRVRLGSDNDIHIASNDYSLADGDYLLEPVKNNGKKANIVEQANELLNKIPENDNSYKYIKQIAGQDRESQEKLGNPNDKRLNGPSPRSARELLKGYYDLSKPMNEKVEKFVESNINQLKAIENKGREQIR